MAPDAASGNSRRALTGLTHDNSPDGVCTLSEAYGAGWFKPRPVGALRQDGGVPPPRTDG